MDIVDVQQLLEVMAQDAAPVAERIQQLLLPSYFPGTNHITNVAFMFAFGVHIMYVFTFEYLPATSQVPTTSHMPAYHPLQHFSNWLSYACMMLF